MLSFLFVESCTVFSQIVQPYGQVFILEFAIEIKFPSPSGGFALRSPATKSWICHCRLWDNTVTVEQVHHGIARAVLECTGLPVGRHTADTTLDSFAATASQAYIERVFSVSGILTKGCRNIMTKLLKCEQDSSWIIKYWLETIMMNKSNTEL